jgi:uracil-DNA glycosylase
MTVVSPRIEASWLEVLRPQFEAPYFAQLKEFLIAERQQYVCYPKGSDIFAAFDRTPFDKVKVVILGQDPYHEPEQAHGLCFSVRQGVAVPPSLVNIIKEINSDLGTQIPLTCGDLSHWADQGVLLLNATLTVRAHQAGSHQHHGWEQFTDAAIQALNQYRQGIVFLLWGSFAISKAQFIDRTKHYVLTAPHPSPLSA